MRFHPTRGIMTLGKSKGACAQLSTHLAAAPGMLVVWCRPCGLPARHDFVGVPP